MGGFEELAVWQKSRELTRQIYDVTGAGDFARDFGLRDQIRRAAVSIMSNIAEGHERGGRAEFHQYLVIAKGSCAEVRCQLYVALDAGYLEKARFEQLKNISEEVGRMLSGIKKAVAAQREAR
jgi:four helix bundle protein